MHALSAVWVLHAFKLMQRCCSGVEGRGVEEKGRYESDGVLGCQCGSAVSEGTGDGWRRGDEGVMGG